MTQNIEITPQQLDDFIADCENAIANEHDEFSAEDVLKHQILLSALQAAPQIWEIINPGEGTYYQCHQPRTFEDVEAVFIEQIVKVV